MDERNTINEGTAEFKLTAHSFCFDHHEIPFCRCGLNAGCLSCGYGRGAIPCNCDLENKRWGYCIPDEEHEKLLEESLEKYKLLWGKMAKL